MGVGGKDGNTVPPGHQDTMGRDTKQLALLLSPLLSPGVACGPATISAFVPLAAAFVVFPNNLHSKSQAAKAPIPELFWSQSLSLGHHV